MGHFVQNNVLIRKLENYCALDEADKRLLNQVVREKRTFKARTDVVKEGEPPTVVHLVIDGFACRYKHTAEGKRQITAYLIPGDFCDLHGSILGEKDHSIGTLSDCQVVAISQDMIAEMTSRPRLVRALWWATLVDEGVLREWLVNLGARDAKKSLAHLFSELLYRMRAVDLVTGSDFELPITQTDLADTVGMTTVHLNRTLQSLRSDGLIELKSQSLRILRPDDLMALCGFNPNYLHLQDRKNIDPVELI